MKLPKKETMNKALGGALVASAIAVSGTAVYQSSFSWPITNGDAVWLHMPCVEFTVEEKDNKETKKKDKVKTCSKHGAMQIHKIGQGPKEIVNGDIFIGRKDSE